MSDRGGRRNYNRRFNDRQESRIEAPEDRLKKAIFTFGEHPSADIHSELRNLADSIRQQGQPMLDVATKAVQVAVIEQPHKVSYLASLVGLLCASVEESSSMDSLGLHITQHCWKCCKETMESNNLRNLRPWIQFFSHLTVIQVVATESFLRLLQNLAHVLDELGASMERLSQVTECIIDALLRAGKALWMHDAGAIESLVKSVKANLSEPLPSDLTNPYLLLHSPPERNASISEARTQLHFILNRLVELEFDVSESLFPQITVQSSSPGLQLPPLTLEDILLAPEQVDVSSAYSVSNMNDGRIVQFTISIFDDEITPAPNSVVGYFVRSVIANVADAFEANRKDGAQALISLPRWLPGMFIQPGSAKSENEGRKCEGNWQLESTLVETLLSRFLNLPYPSILPAHFAALICELCRLSPATFGPAVGKCFRRLHDMTGDGLDVELARRFAEWFAVHMSNFEFRWPPWEEWSPDLKLARNHPIKVFIRNVLELEIRLAYYDRIVRSIPEPFHSPEAGVLNDQAPGPEYAYSDPSHPYHALAQEILNWLQGRTDPAEVISGIENHKERLVDAGENEPKAISILRQIVIQSLLEIGARSFSHFLNAVERYIKLIRHISMGPEAKTDILEAITQFWKKNHQMMLITFNKFMQYQFTEPSDHIAWAFNISDGMIGSFEWQILKEALDKANGRVFVIQKKVDQLRKEQDDAAALQKAHESADMDTDLIVDSERTVPQNAALTSALKSKEILSLEQQRCFELAFDHFIQALGPSSSLFSNETWERHAVWTDSEHRTYETWGWFRHFCRSYIPHLIGHSQFLRSKFDAQLSQKNGPSEELLQKYCAFALSEAR